MLFRDPDGAQETVPHFSTPPLLPEGLPVPYPEMVMERVVAGVMLEESLVTGLIVEVMVGESVER